MCRVNLLQPSIMFLLCIYYVLNSVLGIGVSWGRGVLVTKVIRDMP